MRAGVAAPVLALAVAASGCGSDADADADTDVGDTGGDEDGELDVVATDLAFDLVAMTGRARIELAAGGGPRALEIGDLRIDAVTDDDGAALEHTAGGGRLSLPAVDGPVVVDYGFAEQSAFDGLLASGSTLLWPYHCGNLFPCNSAPADGLRFTLALDGVPDGEAAIFPAAIAADAPAYQVAWAVGAYTAHELGTTPAGTRVMVYWLPGGEGDALDGTADLVAVFDWFERTLGPYSFGAEVGAVSVQWGAGAYGGMEHHPYWHVAAAAMDDAETQAHEAAHGWFGDGIRIRCWEDFVLSEGTVSYLAARALGQTAGAAAEQAVWDSYRGRLDDAVAGEETVAWPDGCGQIDVLEDGLFSTVPYMKGAYFYRAVAEAIGADELDGVLGRFYAAHVGGAAGMQDLLDAIEADTGFDPGALADVWLRSFGLPAVVPGDAAGRRLGPDRAGAAWPPR